MHNDPLPVNIDKELLTEALIEREKVESIGIGNRIAIIHATRLILANLERPVATNNFLKKTIIFSAISHKPVNIISLILCPTSHTYFKLISSIYFLLSQNNFMTLLKNGNKRGTIYFVLSDYN